VLLYLGGDLVLRDVLRDEIGGHRETHQHDEDDQGYPEPAAA
jgi:hypothetical protein